MNTELYEQLKNGVTHDGDGNHLRVTDEEMAAFAWESHKLKLKKTPHRISEYVLLKHKHAVTPFGAHRFTTVHKNRMKFLLGKDADWTQYNIAPKPVGVEKAEKVDPKAKTAEDGDV